MAGIGSSLLPLWRNLYIDPYSKTLGSREHKFGQFLISLVGEIENDARKYAKDWRLKELDRELLIELSTDLCNFLTEAGNDVIAQVPTVKFMYDDIPIQLKSTGQFLLNYAISIAEKAQTLCEPQHPVHYNFRIKIRRILFSAADILETAARALLNPHFPFDLSVLDLEQENEVVTPSPPVPTNVNIPSDRAENKLGNEGDKHTVSEAASNTNIAQTPPSQSSTHEENVGKGKRKNSTAMRDTYSPPPSSSSTNANDGKVTGKRAKRRHGNEANGTTANLNASGPRPPPPKVSSALTSASTVRANTNGSQESVSQTSTTKRRRSLRKRGGDK